MEDKDRNDEMNVDAALAALGVHDTSRECTDRIRARALGALAAGTRRRRATRPFWPRLEPLAALAAGASYMAIVFRLTLELYR